MEVGSKILTHDFLRLIILEYPISPPSQDLKRLGSVSLNDLNNNPGGHGLKLPVNGGSCWIFDGPT